ncbi:MULTISPECIES: transcription elongation factor GreB [Legionella]|uniref:Transcription elongation factor GreB n=1 Tax=Legionella resiliens TaxID=2905958 RepID=A0ABS8X3U9_9GAMM|nr:transcription elongation factor GreB [Legionella sp. PC1000]MCE0722834.1 transcription elongation factor GreB [Legionella sp. 9fVS26]MCE3531987.1 transcription elongation factor GreB [Legionella sp. 8cVS16]QLZ68104.1 transcription elongation factor GreB [Legionella sp. PC1000]
MSKAFTKEGDEYTEPERPDLGLPSVKNYMTPIGFAMLQTELRDLVSNERPEIVKVVSWAASNGDRSENGDYIYGKKRLREIDRRIRYLTKRLESAEIVDPKLQVGLTQVFFGATVQYINENGESNSVKIVGLDEADINAGKISWVSPLAKTLLKARVGETRTLRVGDGECNLTVTNIFYEV